MMEMQEHRRRLQGAEGEELLSIYQRRGSVLCACGKPCEEHDITEDFMRPCPDGTYTDFREATESVLYRELKHLVTLLEWREKQGLPLHIPGLATLNGARAAIRLYEADRKAS
jgi:hypothetical protein